MRSYGIILGIKSRSSGGGKGTSGHVQGAGRCAQCTGSEVDIVRNCTLVFNVSGNFNRTIIAVIRVNIVGVDTTG